jgi:outer membrane lipoprotein-sorting protein
MVRGIFAAAVALALALGTVPGEAREAKATPPAADVKGADTKAADLARIEKYMNDLRTMSAHFLQSTSDGGEAEGTLYLSRPGKLRVEYNPPNPILIVSDGTQVHYYDSELGQVSTIGLSSTPAAVLVRESYKLGTDIHVVNYERGPGVIRVTLEDANNTDAGQLTLTFQDNPLILKQWKVLDAQGVETTVALTDPRRDVALSPKLFVFENPAKTQVPFGNN